MTQQAGVVMKKRKFTTCFLLRLESIFHESINYTLCDILNLPQWIVWTDFSSFSLNSCWNIKISLFSGLSSVVFSSALLNPTLGLYCCSFSRSLSLFFFFYILPPPRLICFLTAASGYLVVVAPGAVWLADCGRQLFGGEPIAAVAEVGHPCADRVISSEHTSVHWRAGYTAWHSCRRWKGQLLTHVDGQCEPHAREMWPATPGKHRGCRQAHCSLNSSIVMSASACESSLFGRTGNVEFFQHFSWKKKSPEGTTWSTLTSPTHTQV